MQIHRSGIYVTFFAATLLVSGIAYAATQQWWLSNQASLGIRALFQLAYDGNVTTGDPVPITVPANVNSFLTCGTFQGVWKCWGESELVCPTAIAAVDMDTGQSLTCEVDCDLINGECDCDIESCS